MGLNKKFSFNYIEFCFLLGNFSPKRVKVSMWYQKSPKSVVFGNCLNQGSEWCYKYLEYLAMQSLL